MTEKSFDEAISHFKTILNDQQERVKRISKQDVARDFSQKESITIGICWGDGIGEEISNQAQTVLEHCLCNDIKSGRIKIKPIKGLTIENRVAQLKAIPDDVLTELKSCDVILKGPTTTPQKGDGYPNIESANVAMRRELDLYACVRPVKVPKKNIDWVFFRENTEGAYMLGSKGIDMAGLSIDFKVISDIGAERIIRMAFEYAKVNNRKKVTVVTKSNVVKATDGRFSEVAMKIAKEYDNIECDEWYIDIMSAKLIDEKRQSDFEVFVLPNLYGDILTDEASQIQGGVGTAGSANIGNHYAMFEAVHGSAPRMVNEGRAQYADPSSMIKAASMLLRHIGYIEQASKIDSSLDVVTSNESNKITGRSDGLSANEFTALVLKQL
ncbi:MAG: isocitrate/isopropylmalate family dehydrogenase [Candidatus Margulisiibacteriota bacterium]|nr:isocitrate/isopropylmalate family dehydrogenase [Candidatus Margulisiibacteriota bacterium]